MLSQYWKNEQFKSTKIILHFGCTNNIFANYIMGMIVPERIYHSINMDIWESDTRPPEQLLARIYQVSLCQFVSYGCVLITAFTLMTDKTHLSNWYNYTWCVSIGGTFARYPWDIGPFRKMRLFDSRTLYINKICLFLILPCQADRYNYDDTH